MTTNHSIAELVTVSDSKIDERKRTRRFETKAANIECLGRFIRNR
ncbi:hypothetical protein [Pollutimonas nitritireducens]|nr:hypothetical protein [Pollutimonas nitritireducens]